MDSRQNVAAAERLTTIPRIRRRAEQWRAAAPSHPIHLALGAGWVGFLYTIGLFSAANAEASSNVSLGFVDVFALAMFMVTLVGIFVVISLALQNSRFTAPVSMVAGLSVIVVAATCGLVGHPASAWGPDAALAAVLVTASAFIMSRRDTSAQPA